MTVKIDHGFTLIETLIASALLVLVLIAFFLLFKYSFSASNRGQVSAQTREHARIALDRIETELRQAVPVPTGSNPPLSTAVIFPGPQGALTNAEASTVGCNRAAGSCSTGGTNPASPLNPSILIAAPFAEQRDPAQGPTGFVVFSEILQVPGGPTGLYVPGDQNYQLNPANYIWVMYQVTPNRTGVPALLVRYTFNAFGGGTFQGIRIPLGGTAWERVDSYFVPANSRETASGSQPAILVSLDSDRDEMWFMVSHAPNSSSQQSMTGNTYDSQYFTITAAVNQFSQLNQQANAPPLSATLSSSVKAEGSIR